MLRQNNLLHVSIHLRKTIAGAKGGIYASMKSKHGDKWNYSAALTQLQIHFVSTVPAKVKNVIRLVKFWKKSEFQVNQLILMF